MSKYCIIKRISGGTYGETYEIIRNGQPLCLKKYIVDNDDFGFNDDYIKEIIHLNSDYTKLNLLDTLFDEFAIITNLYTCDLSKFICKPYFTPRHLVKSQINGLIPSILEQMYQLHITGFCHSDLKLENILEKLGDFCICDYGLTEYYGYPRVIKDYQCTRYFKAPDKRISINVDLYGWGACLFYLFTGLSITFKDSLTELDVSLMENKLKKYLDNTSIEIIKRLISKENSRPTAKQLLIQYYNFTPKYTINNIDKLLETSISNNKDIDYNYDDGITTLDHVVFKSLKMKRTPYYQYSYNDLLNHRNFEIDYLDDTFAYYYNYHISTPQICSKKYRPIVNEILRQYFNTHLHMESLFLAIHIFNNINTELDLKVEDYHDFTKILMNYSCKYLEYHQYIINLSTLKKDDIFSLEKTIIKKMVDNHISFIPVTFNIYYYLTRLVQTMKLSYNYYFSNLESVCLSILTFFMINMPVGKKFNVHLVCLNILIHAIYFINNNELDTKSNFSGFIFKTVNLLEPAILNKIVEYSPFLEYLQKNLDK